MRKLYVAVILLIGFVTFCAAQDPVPDFTVTDTEGKTHNLYTYLDAGKYVLLDFKYDG